MQHILPSAGLCFALLSAATLSVSRQTTVRVSLGNGGVQGDSESYYPALSADGRYVAFYSDATNLVPGDTNATGDVFVRDRRTGTTTRVSVDSAGVQGDGESSYPSISADGRYVAFSSKATHLVPGDTNAAEDVFVHDRQNGTTTRVSVDSNGVQGDSNSWYPSISADGRVVAFQSTATNLVSGDTNGVFDIFVHDRVSGITTRVSVGSMGAQSNAYSLGPSICADGSRVAFWSAASNLVAGATMGGIFVRDLTLAATVCASVDSNGVPGGGGGYPSISGDGRIVAFAAGDMNHLVPGDTNGVGDIFVHDFASGATELVSVDSNGVQANDASTYLAISYDGRFVAFGSFADNLVPDDANGEKDIFLRDRRLLTTTRMSVNSLLRESNGHSSTPAISADGRFVAFYSDGDNLVHGDTNGERDVFVRNVW